MKQRAASGFTFIEPMKALRVPELPAGNWLYEMKFDGYRALAFKAGREVRLISRNKIDFGDDYPLLLDALKSLVAKSFVIDGEIAALDQNGRSSFQLLQSYGIRKNIPLVYYAFDLLSLEEPTSAINRCSDAANCWPGCLKELPLISASPRSCRGPEKHCWKSRRSSGLRAWSLRGWILLTRPAGAAVPGSRSKLPGNRSL
jgi:hypothetical protein